MKLSVQAIKKILRNIRETGRSGQKIVLILNYHRIGTVDPENPFHKLHTVSPGAFRRQVSFMAKIAKKVSLADIKDFAKLDKINFCITFDDVSTSIRSVKPFLTENKIPYTICPCVEITSKGYGIRDKVYCIVKNRSERSLFDFVKKAVGNEVAIQEETFSFYHFTKSKALSPIEMESQIIDPLFKSLPEAYVESFGQNYLSWQDIRDEYLHDPLVTIANHSQRHMNMTCLTREDLAADIELSYAAFEKELGMRPQHYTVPFGDVTQNLMYDFNEYLKPYDCQSVLWVHGGLNLLKQPLQHQIQHLSRIHAPEKFGQFCFGLAKTLKNTHGNIEDFLPLDFYPKVLEKKVLPGSLSGPATSFENIVRYGKDYASDEGFYDYCYSNNPYKQDRPDYYSVVQEDRLTTIGYNFHMRFLAEGKPVPGVYWANWRKSPQSERGLGKLVVRKALEREPVLAIYRPSAYARAATEITWFPIAIAGFDFSRADLKADWSRAELSVETSESYPESMGPLLEIVNQSSFFSIERSPEFYRWRYDQYPSARRLYLVSSIRGIANGFFVVLYKEKRASISDFYCETPEVFGSLLNTMAEVLLPKGVEDFHVETSGGDVLEWLRKNMTPKPEYFDNVYGFNHKLFPDSDFLAKVEVEWGNLKFHETQACGDILLR